MIVAADKVV